MDQTQSPHLLLDYTLAPLASLGLHGARRAGSIVGRSAQLAAVAQELTSALDGLCCLSIEGEPGIGKTRLLIAAEEQARARGFVPIAVTADEEIRGPFLLARSIFGSAAAVEAAAGTPAEAAMRRMLDVLSNQDDSGLQALAPSQQLLRVFDLGAVALRALAAEHPLAVLIDDLQWADEDSLRMLRYVVRADGSSPILLVVACRPAEMAFVNEAVTLLADIERMGLLRRLKLGRFTQLESTEFLQDVLGGQISLSSAAVMHAQAEGVPFVLGEQARAYREAGLIQQIDGVWTLGRNAERLLPSAVRTLIQRRAARLPEQTRAVLADAAILGRTFSLRDLAEVKTRLGDGTQDAESLAQGLAPAVAAGLLVQHPDDSPADYSFSHEQIREYGATSLSAPRRRAIHGAIVDLFTSGGEPSPGSLPMLAQHALAAGRADLCARVSLAAGRNALDVHAPEEALRQVELAQTIVSSPQDRIALLCLRDDALAMLRRATQRLEALTELTALVEALGDEHLKLDVMLRRAAALRLLQEVESAADLARRVRQQAVQRQDLPAELAACLELGQDLLHSELGEGYVQASSEVDLGGAEEAYQRAAAIAGELGNERLLAAATRELGIIALSRLRAGFVEAVYAGEHIPLLRRIAAGEKQEHILHELPIAVIAMEASTHFRNALEIYERLGDRQGAMSTIIAMAYVSWGPEIHLNGSAKRIEDLRRLMGRINSFTKESERALADAQMVFGAEIYGIAKGFADAALQKGTEAYSAARAIGERTLEFAAAGGVALVQAQLGNAAEAEQWLARAAAVVLEAPTPWRNRQLQLWRGLVSAGAGDATGMRTHLERAVQLATEQSRPAERCEALAQLALQAARLGKERTDEELLGFAERSAQQVLTLAPLLPGHHLWDACADAALARVALARGGPDAALEHGRSALTRFDKAMREDVSLDILLPASEALLACGGEEEAAAVRSRLRLTLAIMTQRISDESLRRRWLESSTGRELARLAGPLETIETRAEPDQKTGVSLDEAETRLLELLVQGQTNREIAETVGFTEEAVARGLASLFVKIGASSRADATANALAGNLV